MSFRSLEPPLVKRDQVLTTRDPEFDVGTLVSVSAIARRSGEDASAARVAKYNSGEQYDPATP